MNMSTVPSIEAIALEVQQSLGLSTKYSSTRKRSTKQKDKFANGQCSLEVRTEMFQEIIEDIFLALDLEDHSKFDVLSNLEEFANDYKDLELKIWTYNATSQQIAWMLLGYVIIPAVARRFGFWNLETKLDSGMPSGKFWYLPESREVNGNPTLCLPVAQVIDWLLDLEGLPLEKFADARNEATDETQEAFRRSLYNWKKDTTLTHDSILKYFSDDSLMKFKGVFALDTKLSPDEQFEKALDFTEYKKLTPESLRHEIPMTQKGRLESILEKSADAEERALFVSLLADRYRKPSMHTIRQRLLLTRAIQDGYSRLLKFLFPQVNLMCADPRENKLLQLIEIYKLVYNSTIEAWNQCKEHGEAAENKWFEESLEKHCSTLLSISILPSKRMLANDLLSQFLTRFFFEAKTEDTLEDHFIPSNEKLSTTRIRDDQRLTSLRNEAINERQLIDKMRRSSPWRALQNIDNYWILSQVAQNKTLNPAARKMAIDRIRELASTPIQTLSAICFELDGYLNSDTKHNSKDTPTKVEVLIEEAEANEAYSGFMAGILQFKAKHMLAKGEFHAAGKIFREAFDSCSERNYGPLKGILARDALATEVANGKLIPNNHEKYYRGMLDGGIVEGISTPSVPPIQELAHPLYEYFWKDLYKPYPGIDRQTPIAMETAENSIKVVFNSNLKNLTNWIKENRRKLNAALPMASGDTVMTFWVKAFNDFKKSQKSIVSFVNKNPQIDVQGDLKKFEALIIHWHQCISLLAEQAPKQLNITDWKGQTPLMLMAEAGDSEMVNIMLKAGADSDIQDWNGMTALHSAIKSRENKCVDFLLDHPCRLDLKTIDQRTPLHTATWTGNIHAIQRLLVMAPELARERDKSEFTPLEFSEHLLENPEAYQKWGTFVTGKGKQPISKQTLKEVVLLLEDAPLAAK
jgi:hypothetical protein